MRTYTYRARNVAGRILEGTIRAGDAGSAHSALERDGLTPVNIALAADRSADRVPLLFGRKVRADEVIMFTRQLSTMLRAGVPILQALRALQAQTESPALRRALEGAAESITGGSRLSEAFAEFPEVFSSQFVSIVVSGESGADMVEALLRMADWMEREQGIRREIASFLRYPATVALALIGATAVIVGFVVPRFAVFYAKAGVALPLATRILVEIANLVRRHGVEATACLVALIVLVFASLKSPSVRLRFDRFKCRMPVVGPVYRRIVVSRFARILAMLVKNGVPILKALEISSRTVGNTHFRNRVEAAKERIEAGGSISEGFDAAGEFPPMLVNLIAVGEKTGALDEMLDFMVIQYDMEITYSFRKLSALIEPVTTCIVGVAVLLFALGVYSPIWNMAKAITKQ